MNAKWFFSTLVITLAMLGVRLQDNYVSNQEIVVQFSNDEVTSETTKDAIATVKKQLQHIGANNIKVHQYTDGSLKITYYSDIDVASIKEIFSTQEGIELGYTSSQNPTGNQNKSSQNETEAYKLNVGEIQNSVDGESDFAGFLVEKLPENERLQDNSVKHASTSVKVNQHSIGVQLAYTIQTKIANAIDCSSISVPDTRAGPIS